MLDYIKGMLQSKTAWFGGGVTLIGVLSWVNDHSALILALQPHLGPLLSLIGPVIVILRVLTEASPAWKAPEPPAQPSPPRDFGSSN